MSTTKNFILLLSFIMLWSLACTGGSSGGEETSTSVSNSTTSSTDNPTVNTPPTGSDKKYTVRKNTVLTILLAGQDIDGDTISWVIKTAPAHGTLSGTPPQLIYTPETDYLGSDSFTYQVYDQSEYSPSYTVSIEVKDPNTNTAPVASDLSLVTNEDTEVSFVLSATDADDDVLTWSNPSVTNGELRGTAPSLTFTPASNFFGTVTFRYTVSDGVANSNIATVIIEVLPVNDAFPVPGDQAITTKEDRPIELTLTATDIDFDTISFSFDSPQNGTVTLLELPATLVYTPTANFYGADSFQFWAHDGFGQSPTSGTIAITVTPVNDSPVAFFDTTRLVTPESESIQITLTASDVEDDALGLALSFSIVDGKQYPEHGALEGTPPNLTYVPNGYYSGPDKFFFTTIDSGGKMGNIATVYLTITGENDAPTVAYDTTYTFDEDGKKIIQLRGEDLDGDPITFELLSWPENGTLTGAPPTVTYQPDAHYNGPDFFLFRAHDNGGLFSNIGRINLDITSISDPPAVVYSSYSTNEEEPLLISFEATDPDSLPEDLIWTRIDGRTYPKNGTVSGVLPNITYTPHTNFPSATRTGSDIIKFAVTDETSLSSGTISVTVSVHNIVEGPSTANDLMLVTTENNNINFVVTASQPANDPPLDWDLVTTPNPLMGLLFGEIPDSLTYIPNLDVFGYDSFTFRIYDGDAYDIGQVKITINEVINTYRVDSRVNPSGNGQSWLTAFTHPQDAIDAASAGDHIWVANGVYTALGSNDFVIAPKPGQKIYGGFIGGSDGEATLEDRLLETANTIFDGENMTSHVVIGEDGVWLANCNITRGAANTNGSFFDQRGGGILFTNGGTLTLLECKIFENTAGASGGGIFNTDGLIVLQSCALSNNYAQTDGGGIFNETGNIRLESSLDAPNNLFDSNTAGDSGGGIFNANGTLTVNYTDFISNSAAGHGGAIANDATLYHLTVKNSYFTSNSAASNIGGGIYTDAVTASIVSNIFFDNAQGASLHVNSGATTATNNTFYNQNIIYQGCAITQQSDQAMIVSNTIIWVDGIAGPTYVPLSVAAGSDLLITYSDIYDGISYPGTGNIDADPQLTNPTLKLFYLGQFSPCIDAANSDLAPATDMLDQPRVDITNTPNTGVGSEEFVDMGALERQDQ